MTFPLTLLQPSTREEISLKFWQFLGMEHVPNSEALDKNILLEIKNCQGKVENTNDSFKLKLDHSEVVTALNHSTVDCKGEKGKSCVSTNYDHHPQHFIEYFFLEILVFKSLK